MLKNVERCIEERTSRVGQQTDVNPKMEDEMLLFDLDNTLLRTGMLTRLALADLAAVTRKSEEELYDIADKMEWEYTFPRLLDEVGFAGEEHAEQMRHYNDVMLREGNGCLYPGVVTLVNTIAFHTNVGLLTRGVEAHQRGKFAALTALHRAIPEHRRYFVTPEQGKGVVLESFFAASDKEIVLVDDNPGDLIDVFEKAPHVRLVRMAWSDRRFVPSPHDGKMWKVAEGICSLVRLIRKPSYP